MAREMATSAEVMRHQEDHEDLAVDLPPVGRAADQRHRGGVEHDLDPDQDHDQVAARQDAAKPQDEEDGGKQQDVGEGHDHDGSSRLRGSPRPT